MPRRLTDRGPDFRASQSYLAKMTARPSVEEIFERRYEDLVRFVRYRIRDPDEARDLAQEAFLRLLRQDRAELIKRPESYLFRIAANLAYEHRLRLDRRGTETGHAEGVADRSGSPEPRAGDQEHLRRIDDAFNRLPPLPRAALLLQRRDGLSYAEIAARLGTTRHMVKKHLSRAMAACRAALDDDR